MSIGSGIAIAGIWIGTALIAYFVPSFDSQIVIGSTIATIVICCAS